MIKLFGFLCTVLLSWQALAFPITVEHKYGSIHLDKKPTRIVSVGVSDQDDILALGVKPLAIREWYGNQPYAVWPWAQEALGEAKPVVLRGSSLDYEQIAALKPDLIVAVSSALSRVEYQQLSKIAPTLVHSKGYSDWMMPWDKKHLLIGRALGLEKKAQDNIDDIEILIAKTKLQHPEFQGKTAVVGFYYNKLPGAYASKDLRSSLLKQLGFTIPKDIDALAGNRFYTSFSEERLDLLNTDVLIWLGSQQEIEDQSTALFRKRMPFYREHREYFTGQTIGGAFSFYSPLSIRFLINAMVPELAKIALKKQ